jgi:xanthine dehydrogenase accessory factor
VQRIAKGAILSKKSGHYHFELDNDISQQEEAICGGQISILVDAALSDHWAVLEQLKHSLQQRIPGVLVTKVTNLNDTQVNIHRFWVTENGKHSLPLHHFQRIEPAIRSILAIGNPRDYRELSLTAKEQEGRFFLEPVFPLPQLVIAGAGHIGKALAHLGRLLDFEVVVIDERADYANRENIPDADHIVVDDIGQVMQAQKKTSDTYIVIVTRGHKNDTEALKSCIGSGAAYVGMIGSANKIALMRRKFVDEGLATSGQWSAIHTPIGLEIGSKTVQEIAVSIAAQLIQVRNNKVQAYA